MNRDLKAVQRRQKYAEFKNLMLQVGKALMEIQGIRPLSEVERMPFKKFLAWVNNMSFVVLFTLANREHKISSPPGSSLRALAEFLCSRKTFMEIACPLIADLQFEYSEALFAGRTLKAAFIRVRYAITFLWALGLNRALKVAVNLFHSSRP